MWQAMHLFSAILVLCTSAVHVSDLNWSGTFNSSSQTLLLVPVYLVSAGGVLNTDGLDIYHNNSMDYETVEFSGALASVTFFVSLTAFWNLLSSQWLLGGWWLCILALYSGWHWFCGRGCLTRTREKTIHPLIEVALRMLFLSASVYLLHVVWRVYSDEWCKLMNIASA